MEARGRTAPKVIRTNDKAWRALPIAGLGEYYQAASKLARQTGVQDWLVLHRFSDLRAAGARAPVSSDSPRACWPTPRPRSSTNSTPGGGDGLGQLNASRRPP